MPDPAPQAGARATPSTKEAAREAAMRILWRLDENRGIRLPHLFAILDAARDETIYPTLRRFAATEQIASLYQGPTAEELAAVAPYLVCLGTGTELFDWIFDNGWGQSWGSFIWSLVGFEELRAHFRKLTKVRTEDGHVLVFRYYDPRVLSVFLPTCGSGQIDEFFGSAGDVFLEADNDTCIGMFRQSQGILTQSRLRLK
jgi:hypothetical protein